MTTARQLPIFTDCPYGGCEDGYFESCEDLDEEELDEETRQMLDDLAAGRAVIHRGRFRHIHTLQLPAYTPAQGT